MTTFVRFRTPKGECAIPVDQVREVRLATGLRPLPAPREGVVGLLPREDDALSVLAVLGSVGRHVMVVDDGTLEFGLLVDEVLGVQNVEDASIDQPPAGQDRAVVAGVVSGDGTVMLVLDLEVLRGRLVG
jgi:chemotaxis signal transduction protein